MPGFDDSRSIRELPPFEAVKKYDDEEIIWIYNEVLHLNRMYSQTTNRRRELKKDNIQMEDIKKFKSFEEIRHEIIKMIIDLNHNNNEEIINRFFKEINRDEILNRDKQFFSFLKDEKRLCFFMVNSIENSFRSSNSHFIYYENPYIYIVHYFSNIGINTNFDKFYRVKRIFSDQLQKDSHNNSPNFENYDFLKWAYAYLKERDNEFKKTRYTPGNQEEHKNYIVAYLDYLLDSDDKSHYVLTRKLFKAWSQKKFRAENREKKPYHLPLTIQAKSELKKLSDFKNKSESTILEDLIHQMYLNEMCDEDGKQKY